MPPIYRPENAGDLASMTALRSGARVLVHTDPDVTGRVALWRGDVAHVLLDEPWHGLLGVYRFGEEMQAVHP